MKKQSSNKNVFVPSKCFADAEVINLKLHLKGTNSVRVVSLPGNMRMSWFAKAIMGCFGFLEYHLYHFEDNRFNEAKNVHGFAAMFRMIESEAEQMRREVRILQKTIAEVFPMRGDKATFLYDYGDDWRVEITRMADRKNAGMFECVKSEGINAYEDIGGPWRLNAAEEMCEDILVTPSLRKKLDEDDKNFLEWLLGDEEELFEENLRYFLTPPTRESLTELLRGYNIPDVIKCEVPEFYDELYDGDILDDTSLEDGEDDEE